MRVLCAGACLHYSRTWVLKKADSFLLKFKYSAFIILHILDQISKTANLYHNMENMTDTKPEKLGEMHQQLQAELLALEIEIQQKEEKLFT